MILRKLIDKLISLLDKYQKENANPDLGFALNAIVTPVVNAAKSVTTDLTIKNEKILASEGIKIYLEEILKASKIEASILSKVRERFETEISKAKNIRKENPPGTYDGVLETCFHAIDKGLYYFHLCGLKDSKEEDIASDPRLILENFMLDYLIDFEIMKKSKYAPKATMTRLFDLFSGWGGKEESLAEELVVQVQEFLCKLDIACKNIEKNTLQYSIIVEANINSALYEEAEKCKSMGVESNPLKTLLLQARAEIHKLESHKLAKDSLVLEMKKKGDESNQDIRGLFSKRFEEKKIEDEQRYKDELEQRKRASEAAKKRKEEEIKKQKEEEVRKKLEEENKKKADETQRKKNEEDEKKRIEEARKKAEEDKRKEESQKQEADKKARDEAAKAKVIEVSKTEAQKKEKDEPFNDKNASQSEPNSSNTFRNRRRG